MSTENVYTVMVANHSERVTNRPIVDNLTGEVTSMHQVAASHQVETANQTDETPDQTVGVTTPSGVAAKQTTTNDMRIAANNHTVTVANYYTEPASNHVKPTTAEAAIDYSESGADSADDIVITNLDQESLGEGSELEWKEDMMKTLATRDKGLKVLLAESVTEELDNYALPLPEKVIELLGKSSACKILIGDNYLTVAM